MNIRTLMVLIFTHIFVGAFGFVIGIYALPILIAPPSPSVAEIEEMSSKASYTAEFVRDLRGSDALHWGEGKVSIGNNYITLMGKLAPGPDYKLYLSKEFVETESEVEALKSSMLLVGDVKTFDNFFVDVPPNINVSQFNTVVIWCETFGEFITSAKYR
ncbi:MAG: DM13 domain-containing protein [Halioglobus sp.]|nr:DM13 domain-containing protein [Halioglobus sp.]